MFQSRRLLACCELLTSSETSIQNTDLNLFHGFFFQSTRKKDRQVLSEFLSTRLRVEQPVDLVVDEFHDGAANEGFRDDSFLLDECVPLLDVLLLCSVDITKILNNVAMLLNKPTLVGRWTSDI